MDTQDILHPLVVVYALVAMISILTVLFTYLTFGIPFFLKLLVSKNRPLTRLLHIPEKYFLLIRHVWLPGEQCSIEYRGEHRRVIVTSNNFPYHIDYIEPNNLHKHIVLKTDHPEHLI